MHIDIIETLQKNLGYPPLKKIDPNTQDVKDETPASGNERLAQAAIPAVLTGLYKYSSDPQNAAELMTEGNPDSLLDKIFGDNKAEAVRKVAEYAGSSPEQVLPEIKRIALEAVRIVKDQLSAGATGGAVKDFLVSQRNHLLSYLPASLQIGDLLKDNTLDDRTNKMEGPISSLMHKIENAFSGSSTKDNDESK